MFFVPESPRWLAKNGKPAQARGILARIGGGDYATAALAEIQATLVNETRKVNFRDLLEPKLKRMLFLGIALAVLQQWCGINVIFYYAKDVFKDSGFKMADILINIVFIGSVNLLATLVALKTVDRWGRSPLMLFGYAGLTVLFVVMGLCFAFNTHGVPHAAHRPGGHRLLRHVARPDHLGPDRRDIPQPHPRRRHVHRRHLPLDRLLRAH